MGAEETPLALASAPFVTARGIVAASGTSVVAVDAAAVALPVPDNCHTVLITNPSAAVVGLVGRAAAPTALVAGTNAQRIPSSSTLTLQIGQMRQRGPIDQGQLAGSGFVYDSIGGAVTLEITYLCQLGGPGDA